MSRHFNPLDGLFDERGESTDEGVTCKFCGEEGLYWVDAANGPRLADDHGLHVCKKVATPDDFDEVKE